jgi:serralysin
MDDIRMAHVCVDRPLPLPDLERASDIAVDMRPDNRHELEGVEGVELHPQAMALLRGKFWPVGHKIKVGFLGGTKTTQARVFAWTKEWSKYAMLDYVQVDPGDAEVRIAFQSGEGSWSFLGTDILSIKRNQITMNLGWIDDDTSDVEVRRVTLHELGHTNGAAHEHQSPGAGGPEWNLPAVYAFFGGPPNSWSHDEIDAQVVEKLKVSQTQFTAFDPTSIMAYEFNPPLVKVRIPGNTQLSPMDKQFITSIYPGRDGVVVPKPAPPVPVSDLPVVEVGAPGLRAVIPGGPKPAALLLHKAKANDFRISVIVRGTGGHAPIVTLAKSDGDGKKSLILSKDADGAYITNPMVSRPAGDYLLSIYHPLAGHGGYCRVEAKYAA